MKIEVILERSPYRYVQVGLLRNGFPDYRIQKYNDTTERYEDIYLLDSGNQLDYAIEDFEYTKWLDPDGVPSYKKHEYSEEAMGNLWGSSGSTYLQS